MKAGNGSRRLLPAFIVSTAVDVLNEATDYQLGETNMNKIERYTWEDAVIDTHADYPELFPNGAVMLCLKLARAINWVPGGQRAGKPSGLYWKNEDALKAVGVSRATYFRYRTLLFDLGFFTEERGNLIPQVPTQSHIETVLNAAQSHVETIESQVETVQSHIETDESLGDNPYSEDNTVNIYSEDNTMPVVANAPTAGAEKSIYSNLIDYNKVDSVRPLLLELDNLLPKMKSSSLSSSSSALFTEDSAPVSHRDYERYRYQWERDTNDGTTSLDLPEYTQRKQAGQGVGKYAW